MRKQLVETPSVILINPQYEHNVGGALRTCSCYGIKTLLWTGNKVIFDEETGKRLPREERMKGYKDVERIHCEKPLTFFADNVVPVCVEVKQGSESLTHFEHPDNAVYIFGPENGSVPQVIQQHCHRFVHIPTHHCLNLSCAIATVLFHRRLYRQLAGKEPVLPLEDMLYETRGHSSEYGETPVLDRYGWDGK